MAGKLPVEWLQNPDIRPYVFVRAESEIVQPGYVHRLDWFVHQPVFKDPMRMASLNFANLILHLETLAFGPKNLQMPRWVFYDCAILPGFVAGFAQRTSTLSAEMRALFKDVSLDEEWTPLSLFIIIPTMAPFEWVAHNLCSVNSLLPKASQYSGLGFLSKAFGLWYANVEVCCGITQWQSPAIHLHTHYGPFEVITAYTPVHSIPQTVTYRVKVDVHDWQRFFTRQDSPEFHKRFQPAGFEVDPTSENSMRSFQSRLEQGTGPYYLDAQEVKSKKLHEKLTVYCPRA
jgi:hypothetical protein